MDSKLFKSIEDTMDLYRRNIKPDNRNWNVLSIESGMSLGLDLIYRRFGVGNNYNIVDILSGAEVPGNDWDMIIISQSIQYIFDFTSLLEECHLLLKNGGFLIVDCPFIQEYDTESKYEDYWRISHKALQRLLNDIGFEYGNCGLVNGHLTSALARKRK